MSTAGSITPPVEKFGYTELEQQVTKMEANKEEVILAPSMEELLRRVNLARGLVAADTTTQTEKRTIIRWLVMVDARSTLDEATRRTITELKNDIEETVLTPEELLKKIETNAKDPKKFDEFITLFLKKRATYSPEYKVYQEFNAVWDYMITRLGYTAKVDAGRLMIYDAQGNLDASRTASLARVPDMVSFYQKQMTYLRAQHDTVSRSAKERAQNMVAEYNKTLKKGMPTLPALTDAILTSEATKNIYITDVTNSGMAEADKAIIIHFLKDPREAEATFLGTQKAATETKKNIDEAETISKKSGVDHMVWSKANRERWGRNPGEFVSEFISNMGGWIAPSALYLILNLFGVGHDSLFMKILAGATLVGGAKSLGILDYGVDVATGKSKMANDAVDSVKKAWNTSSEDGVIKWIKDIYQGAANLTKEQLARFEAWKGFSNYQASYLAPDGSKKDLPVMSLPFDYIQSHIDAGSFDALMPGNQTMKTNGSDYRDFADMVKKINLEGIKNYGEKRWAEIRTGRTLADIITVAHDNNGVPLSQMAGRVASTAKDAGNAVAGAAVAAGTVVAGAATSVVDAAGKATDTLKEASKPAVGYLTGNLTPEQQAAADKIKEQKDAEVNKYENAEKKRTERTNVVLADKNFVGLVNKNSPKAKIEVYLDLINSKKLQMTLSVQDAADIIYDGKLPSNIALPSETVSPVFINILAKYLTGSYGQKKADKEKFFTGAFADKTKMLIDVI